jgi:hypothetical protein
MASSNVQLQEIQTQLTALGVPNPAIVANLQNQILNIQKQISTMDKTNTLAYSAALQQLYTLQSRLASSNTAAVQDLIQQKINLLEILTQQ